MSGEPPVTPTPVVFEINIPITLSMTADAMLFGERQEVATHDYCVTNIGVTDTAFSLSAAKLSSYIQYKDAKSGNPVFQLVETGTVKTDLVSEIDTVVSTNNVTIVPGPSTKPITYALATTGPNAEPLCGQYVQYLASLLFGHPQARAPIKNEDLMNTSMQNSNLGTQFCTELASNSYKAVKSIFEQYLKYESAVDRFAVDDINFVGVPFVAGDIISFRVGMSGGLNVESADSAGGTAADLSQLFSSTLEGVTISPTDSTSGSVAVKYWLVRIVLSA